jgi:hypothetical protein
LHAADVLKATLAKVSAAFKLPNLTVAAPIFAGTTAYVWDGVGIENRRHQIQINISALYGDPIPTPHLQHTVTLYVLVTFEPETRSITGFLTDYKINTSPNVSSPSGLFGGLLSGAAAATNQAPANAAKIAASLDALLWSPFALLVLPDTNDGNPYSILSVKTLSNGDVNTYIEPQDMLMTLTATGTLTNVVAERIK